MLAPHVGRLIDTRSHRLMRRALRQITRRRHNADVTVHADRRLALLAIAKFAAIGALLGLVLGVGFAVEGKATMWVAILLVPLGLALVCGATLGSVSAVSWSLLPGRMTYSLEDGLLTARRGQWIRKQVPVERIADLDFDQQIEWTHLVFFGWVRASPIPSLRLTLTATADKWDPSNSASIGLPSILISGRRQRQAVLELRGALGLPIGHD